MKLCMIGTGYVGLVSGVCFSDVGNTVYCVDKDKKKVIIVGLDGDSNRNNFGQIHKLIPLCDNITKLKAYCSQCKDGTEGIFSKRLISDTSQTCIGSSDKYMAVCRKCYLE